MKISYAGRAGIPFCVLALFATFLISSAAETDVKFVDAATYYKDGKCLVCHGKAAEKKFNVALAEDELVTIILKGKKAEKPPHMPGYEAKGLTADQAKQLVTYMKSLKQ